jgi:hypothetical protein
LNTWFAHKPNCPICRTNLNIHSLFSWTEKLKIYGKKTACAIVTSGITSLVAITIAHYITEGSYWGARLATPLAAAGAYIGMSSHPYMQVAEMVSAFVCVWGACGKGNLFFAMGCASVGLGVAMQRFLPLKSTMDSYVFITALLGMGAAQLLSELLPE